MYFGLSDKGYGNCVVSQAFDGTLVIERADPRILISAEFVNIMRNLDRVDWLNPAVTLRDDVLTIDGNNQRVIYQIGEDLVPPGYYVAEWPD